MTRRVSVILFAAAVFATQPAFAQDNVITLDLDQVSDEELSGAMDVTTELELIMRGTGETDEGDATPQGEPSSAVEADGDGDLAQAIESEEPAAVAEEAAPEEPAAIAEEAAPEEPAIIAEDAASETQDAEPEAIAESEAEEQPEAIAEGDVEQNEYLIESQRLVRLAEEAYDQGDFETAAAFAEEASRYALLSDEFEAGRIGEGASPQMAAEDAESAMPATFTVRSWATYRDSLWTIAALPEIYGDPLRWRELFEANRGKMPNPNNPDLILPGMVLDIPSIAGEAREGAWQNQR